MGLKTHHSLLQKRGDEANSTNLCSGVWSPLGNHEFPSYCYTVVPLPGVLSTLPVVCTPSLVSSSSAPPLPPPTGCSHHCDAGEEAAALPVASLRDLRAQVRAGGPLVPAVSDSMSWHACCTGLCAPWASSLTGGREIARLQGRRAALKASTLSLDPALCCFPKPGIPCAHSGCRQGERPPAGGLDEAQRRGLVQGQPFHHLLCTPPLPTGWKRNRTSTSSVSGATPRPSATQARRTTGKDCGWAAPLAPACHFLPPQCLEVPPAAASTGRGCGKGP